MIGLLLTWIAGFEGIPILTRQLLYLLPCLLLFPNWWGLKGIWISMPVSDALAFITAVVSLIIYIKKVSKQHLIAE